MTTESMMRELGQQAREAGHSMARATTSARNEALLATARALDASRNNLRERNALDLEDGRERGLDAAMLDRLELTPGRIDAMIEGLYQVATLADPVG